MSRVDMQQGEGNFSGIKCLIGQMDNDDGVFTTREEDDGPLKLCRHLAEYVDALRL